MADSDTGNRRSSVFVEPIILLLVGVVLFIALLNNQTSLTVFCMLVFAMIAGARGWSRLSLAGIRCRLKADKKKLFPGEEVLLTARIENNKFLPIWLQVAPVIDGRLRVDTGDMPSVRDSGLLWYQQVSFDWRLTASRRGVHRVGPLQLAVGDPMGFCPLKKQTADFHDIVVYPRLVPLNPVLLPRRDFFGVPGARSPIEDPVYIHGTRDYQYRRPARFIHWKASARYNRLQEKVCEPAEQKKVLLLVCTDRFAEDETGEAFERGLEVAASLALEFARLRYAVGLATNGQLTGGGRAMLPVTRNRNQLPEILETMARLEAMPRENLVDMLQRGLTLPWGVTGVCLVYRHDAGSMALKEYFKHRNIPLVMIVCDPHDAAADQNLYRLDDIRLEGRGNP
ncbi:MAG: DUF58 domain-containing protein [Pseudomonadota bacterium]